jgi:hypothetical protein
MNDAIEMPRKEFCADCGREMLVFEIGDRVNPRRIVCFPCLQKAPKSQETDQADKQSSK